MFCADVFSLYLSIYLFLYRSKKYNFFNSLKWFISFSYSSLSIKRFQFELCFVIVSGNLSFFRDFYYLVDLFVFQLSFNRSIKYFNFVLYWYMFFFRWCALKKECFSFYFCKFIIIINTVICEILSQRYVRFYISNKKRY